MRNKKDGLPGMACVVGLVRSLDKKLCLSIEGLDNGLLAKRLFNQLGRSSRLCLLLESIRERLAIKRENLLASTARPRGGLRRVI